MQFRPILLASAALIFGPSTCHAAELAIDIGNGIKPGEPIMVAVYGDAANWLKKPNRAVQVNAPADLGKPGRHRVAIDELPPGRYALAVYVDRNGNGKLDSGMFGIPKEPYGFSNGPGRMGPPAFDDAAVELGDADTRIDIKLY